MQHIFITHLQSSYAQYGTSIPTHATYIQILQSNFAKYQALHISSKYTSQWLYGFPLF